jgi:hypothetical protein
MNKKKTDTDIDDDIIDWTLLSSVLLPSTDQEIVPLLDWEIQSAGTDRICNPPNGVTDRCCLGSTSAIGEVTYKPDICNKSIELYNQVTGYTIDYLHNLNSTTNNDEIRIVRPFIDRDGTSTNVQRSNNKTIVLLSDQACDICRIIDY